MARESLLKRDYAAFVCTELSHVIGASGVHSGTVSSGGACYGFWLGGDFITKQALCQINGGIPE
eukprot:10735571-Alexandrium_andersonii.AAC.1